MARDESGIADPNRPIIVVSNRLPFTFTQTDHGIERAPSAGGLITALEPVLRKRGGTWIGWPGTDLPEAGSLSTRGESYDIAPVRLSEEEIEGHYRGLSNATLWPLMHSMVDRTRFDSHDWASYCVVNERFGETAAAKAADASFIWVHDYQLMLAPARIRRDLPGTVIGFFLHIPFPPYDVFRLLPWDRELLRGMLAADLIGFHVRSYATNFFDCVERSLGARVNRTDGLVEYGDHTTRIGAFPLGIDFELFESLALDDGDSPKNSDERVVLGIDRLDYTKGIPERMLAFEQLLEMHPEHRGKVALLQIAVPSRADVAEYQELKREIEGHVGRINGRFANSGWSPIRYLYRAVDQKRLCAIYRDSDVALVTPLRDGMNLVAKEFVACQVADPGVLVLSKLAGAAQTMREALLVNPYDIDGTAEAIHRALEMEEAERRSRMVALRRREKRDDIESWVRTFLEAADHERAELHPLGDSDLEAWLGDFMSGYRLALFLDYDGTLSSLRDHPSLATLSPAMRAALEACAKRDDTRIAVVSGRALSDVTSMVDHPGLIFAGNHGLEIDGSDFPHFIHEDLVHYRNRAEELARSLSRLEVDGAWTEAKGPTLTYHYRAVPTQNREELIRDAHRIINEAGYQARDAHHAVEARPPIGWDKGRAVLHILRSLYGPAWSEHVRVIYVGDDHTDEDAFRFLAGLAMTFRVGSADTPTAATRRLPNVEAVRTLLEWLARRRVQAS
ncbi:MAG: bifunctional alpha,alpha-trehalose-phosphate synthase (UDP-forming)/trehalose-phosphatase [Deltaproteobacteria bacterium]|nr:bifunctional alpha,alpha-trehalose-phosphate synthase (UDP-forming)/trehalose-phosphatase [Deltaproteobacteria bacterium]MBW2667374.1 bifunctional alpha,alpha-trehalose-phosphate synthase (UDP-forming)/trehalose-phosphatase [Deltaproteobacteria bacterium]